MRWGDMTGTEASTIGISGGEIPTTGGCVLDPFTLIMIAKTLSTLEGFELLPRGFVPYRTTGDGYELEGLVWDFLLKLAWKLYPMREESLGKQKLNKSSSSWPQPDSGMSTTDTKLD